MIRQAEPQNFQQGTAEVRRKENGQRPLFTSSFGDPCWAFCGSRLGARAPTDTRRCGYTLLELLIVGVLVSVLMAGVWSLFRNWSGLYERGEQRVQRMQLVRSLCDQFTDDVHAAAQVGPPRMGRDVQRPNPVPPDANGSIAPTANVALVGGADWLILEVIQPANPWLGQEVSEPSASNMYGASDPLDRVVLTAPELRHVVYTFAPSESEITDSLSSSVAEMAAADDTEHVAGEEETEEPPFSGLLRLAVARESPLVSAGRTTGGTASGSRDEAFHMREEVVGGAEPNDLSREIAAPVVETTLDASADTDPLAGILDRDEVREVVWFELRYYDGASWQSSWDSYTQGRLPVAVEMRFELQVAERAKKMSAVDGETELVEGSNTRAAKNMPLPSEQSSMSSSPDETSAVGQGATAETPYYRCVVFLEAKDRP